MKIKNEYVIKTIGDEIIVVPIKDEAVKFNGIISLNKTGAYIFELLQKENLTKKELFSKMLKKFDIDEKTLEIDVAKFIEKINKHDLLQD
ncbi:MAG: PqqD family protein [Tenericutes bacterium]|nr:PqqD family protein [Mycoplasmatota bacterium]